VTNTAIFKSVQVTADTNKKAWSKVKKAILNVSYYKWQTGVAFGFKWGNVIMAVLQCLVLNDSAYHIFGGSKEAFNDPEVINN
jgi:hypothetical protein